MDLSFRHYLVSGFSRYLVMPVSGEASIKVFLSVMLLTVTTLTNRLVRCGSGAFLPCVVLSRAYRQLRVCPLSLSLHGVSLDDHFYLDLATPVWL